MTASRGKDVNRQSKISAGLVIPLFEFDELGFGLRSGIHALASVRVSSAILRNSFLACTTSLKAAALPMVSILFVRVRGYKNRTGNLVISAQVEASARVCLSDETRAVFN